MWWRFVQTKERIFKFTDMQVLYFYSGQNSKPFDISHAFFSLTIAKLSIFKNSPFFGPSCISLTVAVNILYTLARKSTAFLFCATSFFVQLCSFEQSLKLTILAVRNGRTVLCERFFSWKLTSEFRSLTSVSRYSFRQGRRSHRLSGGHKRRLGVSVPGSRGGAP